MEEAANPSKVLYFQRFVIKEDIVNKILLVFNMLIYLYLPNVLSSLCYLNMVHLKVVHLVVFFTIFLAFSDISLSCILVTKAIECCV